MGIILRAVYTDVVPTKPKQAKPAKPSASLAVRDLPTLAEDDADAIISLRRLKAAGKNGGISFRAYLRKHGYEVAPKRFFPPAERELDALLKLDSDQVWLEAMQTIETLEEDPFPPDSILLKGYTDLYRVPFYRYRYRMVYRVSEKQRLVVITRARLRANAYDG